MANLAKLLKEKGITNLGSFAPTSYVGKEPQTPGAFVPVTNPNAYPDSASVVSTTPSLTPTPTATSVSTTPLGPTQPVPTSSLASLDESTATTTPTLGINDTIKDMMSQLTTMSGELGNLETSAPQVSSEDQTAIDLQNQIMESIAGALPTLEDTQTIMAKYDARQQQLQEQADTAKGLTTEAYDEAIGEEKEEGERILTSQEEARRGFATNTALFRQIEDTTKKRVNDLTKQKDNALAMQDMTTADSLNNLILQEQEAITTAKTNYLNSLFSLSEEVRAQRGFETPEETRKSEFENALSLFTQERGIDFEYNQTQSLQALKAQYANVAGINMANSIEEVLGFIGPEIQKDVNLQRRLLEAQIQAQQMAVYASTNSLGGEQLPSNQIVMLSDANFLPTMLTDLENTINENKGLFGVFSGRVPLSGSRDKINAQLKMVSQLVGKFMEGGVLRKEDEEKYSKMLPQLTDLNPDVALTKLKSVRDMLSMKYSAYLTDFSNSGYDVSGFGQVNFGEGKLSVLNMQTGAVGFINPDEYNPDIYEILK